MINWTRKIQIAKLQIGGRDMYSICRQPFFTFNAPSYLYLSIFRRDHEVRWESLDDVKRYPFIHATTSFAEIKREYVRLVSGQYELDRRVFIGGVIELDKVEALLTEED